MPNPSVNCYSWKEKGYAPMGRVGVMYLLVCLFEFISSSQLP